MPFNQCRGRLGQRIRASGDQTVDTAGDGCGTAAAGYQEGRLVALDHGFGNRGLAQPGSALLELGYKFLADKRI